MAPNSISPAFLRLEYFRGTVRHQMIIPVVLTPGFTPGDEPSLELKGGGSGTFSTMITNFVNVIKATFHTTVVFSQCEAWSKPTPTSDPIYIYTHPLNIAGTSGTAALVAGQYVLSHRSAAGGIHRLYLMEASVVANVVVNPPLTGNADAISDFMVASTSFFVARDGGYLVAPTRAISKVNDALRKRLILGQP